MSVRRRTLLRAACAAALATAGLGTATPAAAQDCAPGFIANPYTAQCLAPVSTPIISGQPCIASNIALCSSFVQNLQPPRGPRPVG